MPINVSNILMKFLFVILSQILTFYGWRRGSQNDA
jgi:hypothetical protein